MEHLTDKQRRVLDFIRERVSRKLAPPTIREIAGKFGFSSTGTVRDHLRALARKGYLKLGRRKARAIEVSGRIFGIPVLGRVPAGSPQLAYEDIDGYLDPSEFSGGEDIFCLRVKGDSMKDAGILDGDMVIVRKQNRSEPGEIVVALVGDEATVKYLRRENKKLWLCPANDNYRPIPFTSDCRIAGKVITVWRKYV